MLRVLTYHAPNHTVARADCTRSDERGYGVRAGCMCDLRIWDTMPFTNQVSEQDLQIPLVNGFLKINSNPDLHGDGLHQKTQWNMTEIYKNVFLLLLLFNITISCVLQ